MAAFETVLIVLMAALLLAAAARRVGAPYPAFLAGGGALLAFIPGLPRLTIEPDLALAIFVAPVLLDAAYDASPRDLRDNWAPLSALVIGAVAVTAAVVAFVARLLVPTMPWAAAIALGALVAPPDAAAAIAVLRQLRPPHRILTILEGESLLNDASALLVYRLAIGAAIAPFALARVVPTFLIAVAGGIIAGPILARVLLPFLQAVRDIPSAIILQFATTFGVWVLADSLGLSPILTMVSYAMSVARRAPAITPAQMRVPSYAVWDTVVFLSNVLAFVFIGLQMRPIFGALDPAARWRYTIVAAAVLATVIVVRILWVMSYNVVVRWRIRRYGFHPPRPMTPPTARGALLVSWCGMRGIVTLAAALALPTSVDGAAFPHRDLILVVAFSVVVGTLLLQGLTLAPLLRVLDLRDDDPIGREVALARMRALHAAIDSVDGDASPEAEALRAEFADRLGQGRSGTRAALERLHERQEQVRAQANAAARRAVLAMRDRDEIGDDAFHQLEEQLDLMDLGVRE